MLNPILKFDSLPAYCGRMNWDTKITAKHAKNAKKNPFNLRGLCALRGSKNNHTGGEAYLKFKETTSMDPVNTLIKKMTNKTKTLQVTCDIWR